MFTRDFYGLFNFLGYFKHYALQSFEDSKKKTKTFPENKQNLFWKITAEVSFQRLCVLNVPQF